MNMNCNLCDSEQLQKDYLVSGNLRYAKCIACGLIFQYPMKTQVELGRVYDGNYFTGRGQLYNKEFGYNNYERERSIEIFRKYYLPWLNKYISDKGSFLDFGCGTGNLVKLMITEEHNAEGCEFSSEAISILLKTKTPFYRYDEINKINKRYKYISMIDVIEHLRDPLGDLKTISSLLEDDGFLFIETVNSDDFFAKYIYKNNWHGISAVHLYLLGKNSLIKLLEKAGFRAIAIKTYKMGGSLMSRIIQDLAYMLVCVVLVFASKKENLMGYSTERLKKFVQTHRKSYQGFSFGDGIRIVAKKRI